MSNKLELGFVQGQSDNLPIVDIFMVSDYLCTHLKYTSAEIRGWKLQRSGRAAYGDEAVGYVQVKRSGDMCTVKAKITPEHKIKNKAYCCTFVCNEKEETIVSVECHDCAAQKGGCKHCVAFLMWLHRRSEEPSCTEQKCYWAKPKLATVGTTLKFIKAKDISPHSKTTADNAIENHAGRFREEIVQNLQKKNVVNQLSTYYISRNKLKKISLHMLINQYKKENRNIKNAQNFIEFCSNVISSEECKKAEEDTVSQGDSPLWRELRYCRITASRVHEAAYCKMSDGVLIEQLFGASIPESFAMERGKRLEEDVKSVVSKRRNIMIENCGIFLKPDWPIFGASPDGLTPDFVIEIKCPMTKKGKTGFVKDNCLTKKSKAQIQLQMFFCDRRNGLFCIADENFEKTNEVEIIEEKYDEDYCLDLLDKASHFWKECVFPKLNET